MYGRYLSCTYHVPNVLTLCRYTPKFEIHVRPRPARSHQRYRPPVSLTKLNLQGHILYNHNEVTLTWTYPLASIKFQNELQVQYNSQSCM